eukprot:Anaeramoba_ignava/c18487_g1_i1.p1 GENE.c18487_g1_i1~~c18487_g1_i1.p1  ORF type:complete len:133 (+),score=23.17 c18487_g1_i1:576-974(+)
MKKGNYPILTSCPVCKHDLHAVKLACDHCGTTIDGSFTLSKFNYLDDEKLYFIEVFVKNRGNIKAVEKELNISYPTVKKMLDEAVEGLGYAVDESLEEEERQEEKKASRNDVLAKLSNKEISFEEAMKLLKK